MFLFTILTMAPKKIIVEEPPISQHEETYLEMPAPPQKKAKKEPPPLKYEDVYPRMISAHQELGAAFLKAKELTEVLYGLNSASEHLRVSVMALREIDKALREGVFEHIASYKGGELGLRPAKTWDEVTRPIKDPPGRV